MNLKKFFSELERRKVYKAAIAYGISAWVIAQIVGLVSDSFELPSWVMKMTIILLVIGFLTTMVLSWIFDIGLKGIEKTGPESSDVSDENKPMTGKLVISSLILISVLIGGGWWTWQELAINTIKPIKSLAVLPFDNFSDDEKQGYIASGLQDNLITAVSKIGSLRVTSRPSTVRYKNSDKSSSEIAEELKVDAIIEASIMNFADVVRINIQLIRIYPEEEHLWTQIFERPSNEIYALFNDVTQALAKEIDLVLTPEEETLLTKAYQVNPEAYKAYLNGRFYWDMLTPEALQKALDYYQLAVKIDSSFAPAYAGIAAAWSGRRQMNIATHQEASKEANRAIEKAFALDSVNAEVLYNYAISAGWMEWDWDKTRNAFIKALELNPSHANAQAYYSNFLLAMNETEKAMIHIHKALELDPFNDVIQGLYLVNLSMLRRCDEVFSMNAQKEFTHVLSKASFGICLILEGKYDKAIELMMSKANLRGDKELEETIRKGYDIGGYVEATRRVAELYESRAKNSFVRGTLISRFYANAKQKEKTLEWLEIALAQYDAGLPYITVAPVYDFLRDESRFKAILRKMNLPEN
jgi:TolB-like protein/Tfp pilus assembly protein PilF